MTVIATTPQPELIRPVRVFSHTDEKKKRHFVFFSSHNLAGDKMKMNFLI
jgi:hypothetical protein